MTNKRFGRVGDSPVIGAGTYADPRCGVSATGHGELFIRYGVARDICARVELLQLPLLEAANQVVMDVSDVRRGPRGCDAGHFPRVRPRTALELNPLHGSSHSRATTPRPE